MTAAPPMSVMISRRLMSTPGKGRDCTRTKLAHRNGRPVRVRQLAADGPSFSEAIVTTGDEARAGIGDATARRYQPEASDFMPR
ncbi:MAG: hypothetical protein ACXU9A_23470, partial [Xanthobacteraceae bacterium]